MLSRARIVVADDDALLRLGTARALRDLANLEIVAASGAGDTLGAVLAAARPDLLVIGVTRPDSASLAPIRQVRARCPSLKILVVGAYDEAYIHRLRAAGINGYQLKDGLPSDLRLAVQRVLAGERWVCSPLVEKRMRAREAPTAGPPLTARQCEVLRGLKEGLSNQGIARQTGLSVQTVANHLTRLYWQMRVQSRIEALNYLLQYPEALGAAPALLIVPDHARYRPPGDHPHP